MSEEIFRVIRNRLLFDVNDVITLEGEPPKASDQQHAFAEAAE
jgi:hypothetical protein